jgi:glycosyltransferase involved in cell wall biosynthesis
MSTALVHDYLIEAGGAERVLSTMSELFPDSPVYTSIYDEVACGSLMQGRDVRTTWMNRLTRKKGASKALFPLFPLAFRGLELEGFRVVLSSSSGFAHHVRLKGQSFHACYCHNPPRFLWQQADYFRYQPRLHAALRPALEMMKRVDRRAAKRVDAYIANSATVARRIESVYGRKAEVIHPPVDMSQFKASAKRSGRFLVVSRLLAYKRIDLAVEAASHANLSLDVIGDGPERSRLETMAGPTVRFLGRQPDGVVRDAMAMSIALVLPGVEDFGLTAVEAQASGRPVVAFAAGGALETVDHEDTGLLFTEQSWEALAATMRRAEKQPFSVERLRSSAMRFDVSVFRSRLVDFLVERSGLSLDALGLRA